MEYAELQDAMERMVKIFDLVAHPATDDIQTIQGVHGLRRKLKGLLPSKIIEERDQQDRKQREISRLRKRVSELLEKIADLEHENNSLRDDRDKLEAKLAVLQSDVEVEVEVEVEPQRSIPAADIYSYDDVMRIIRDKFQKQNGGLKLWADYSANLNADDPESPLVTPSRLQGWRATNAFPGWAVEQLMEMPPLERAIYRWSPQDVDYLCQLYLRDPTQTDWQLARACSARFGCSINDNSIKSKLNVLRRLGRIPPRSRN